MHQALDATLPERPGPRRWRPTPLLAGSAVAHGAVLTGLAVAPQLWPWGLGALVADHAALAVAGLVPGSRLLGPVITRLPPPVRDEVSLTFDDGPDPEVTPRVLELLARAGARASFFVVGERAARHPDLIRAIVGGGHRVENHTWSHPSGFALLGPRAQARELDRAQSTLTEITGRAPAYLRPPAGLRNLLLDPLLAARRLHLAAWTRRGLDKADGNPRRVAARLTRRLAAGDILLLHDGRPAATANGDPVILDVLPDLLATLERRGLRCRPLPEPDAGGHDVERHAGPRRDRGSRRPVAAERIEGSHDRR